MFRACHDSMSLIVRLPRSVTHILSALSVFWNEFVTVDEQGEPPLVVRQIPAIDEQMAIFHPESFPKSPGPETFFHPLRERTPSLRHAPSHLEPCQAICHRSVGDGCSNACNCGAAGRA